MSVLDSVRRHKAAVVDRWIEVLLADHAEVSARFFRSEPDPFRNPIGATLRREVPVLLDGVLDGGDPERFGGALDAVVRLRAVAGLSAGHAIGGFLALGRVAREEVEAAGEAVDRDEFLAFKATVEDLALRACDILVACREQLAELRVRETRAAVFTLLRQAGMLADGEADGAAASRPAADVDKGGMQT